MGVTTELERFLRPGTDKAIDRALHDVDPGKFHGRISGYCPFCPSLSDLVSEQFRTNVENSPGFKEAAEAFSALMDAQDALAR